MNDEELKKFKEKFKKNIDSICESYIDDIYDRTRSDSNFITINELEEKLLKVKDENDKLFHDITSEILRSANEKLLISQKKRV